MQFPVFTEFAEAFSTGTYKPVPDGWFVAVSDVVGSTQAIASGRYKDVNLAGAATIAAVQNACGGEDFPFAFGGDGATVLIPGRRETQVRHALAGIRKVSRQILGLDMRCALIPVSKVRERGKNICVAMHQLSAGRHLAMLAGGGADEAEALSKSPSGETYLIATTPETEDADLTGLSCRWKPLQARNGVMLSLIVRARTAQEGIPKPYADIHALISALLNRTACPVAVENLKSSFPPRGAAFERAAGNTLFGIYGQSSLASLSELTGLTIGGFDGRTYKKSLPAHSDYRKYSDSLRMVIDCTPQESDAIEAILNAAHAKNEIDFGLHRARDALMTCFVSSTDEGKHIHFIDGADGGYALAAQQLKAQIATKS